MAAPRHNKAFLMKSLAEKVSETRRDVSTLEHRLDATETNIDQRRKAVVEEEREWKAREAETSTKTKELRQLIIAYKDQIHLAQSLPDDEAAPLYRLMEGNGPSVRSDNDDSDMDLAMPGKNPKRSSHRQLFGVLAGNAAGEQRLDSVLNNVNGDAPRPPAKKTGGSNVLSRSLDNLHDVDLKEVSRFSLDDSHFSNSPPNSKKRTIGQALRSTPSAILRRRGMDEGRPRVSASVDALPLGLGRTRSRRSETRVSSGDSFLPEIGKRKHLAMFWRR